MDQLLHDGVRVRNSGTMSGYRARSNARLERLLGGLTDKIQKYSPRELSHDGVGCATPAP